MLSLTGGLSIASPHHITFGYPVANLVVESLSPSTPAIAVLIDGKHVDLVGEFFTLKRENEKLRGTVEEMTLSLKELKTMVMELYYMPPGNGGPGYELSRRDYEHSIEIMKNQNFEEEREENE